MTKYETYRYLYPPRPETKAPPAALKTYQSSGFIGQPKLNGSCAVIFLNGTEAKIMNRHKDSFSGKTIDKEDLKSLYRGESWMVIVGELMNKSQKNKEGKPLQGVVIFDILVYNGEYLTDTTFIHRHELLQELYPGQPYDSFIDVVGNNVYRVNNFNDLTLAYEELIKIPMYEGLVLKKMSGLLKSGYNEKNNISWQAKIRKPTKNYRW